MGACAAGVQQCVIAEQQHPQLVQQRLADHDIASGDIDGALVGGASLNAAGFARIVQAAVEARG